MQSLIAFQQRLEKDKKTVEVFLKDTLASLQTPPFLLDALHYGTLSGGKRLRPFLVLEAVRVLGGNDTEALPLAGALELVHCYSLIHDDLPSMDNAQLRRGRPTVHCQFDDPTALLAGNSLLTLAIEVLACAPFDASIKIKLIKRLARASGAEGMMAGQHLDIIGEGLSFSLEEITHMQALKTGALIETALLMACDFANASPQQREALSLYGSCLGLSFQIRDDLLDQKNAPELTGKDGAHDHKKSTFVSLLGVQGASQECTRLSQKAVESLTIFQGRALYFEQAAQFAIERQH